MNDQVIFSGSIPDGSRITIEETSGDNTVQYSGTIGADISGGTGDDAFTLNLSGSGSETTTITGGAADTLIVNGTAAANQFALGAGQVTRQNDLGGVETVAYTGIQGLTIASQGPQEYQAAVQLDVPTTVAASTVAFDSTIGDANANADTLAITGNAVFAGAVAGLASLSVSGTALIGAASVTTAGVQSFAGAVTLSPSSTTLQGSTVSFGSTVDGRSSGGNGLTILGASTFGGAVGATTKLLDLFAFGATTFAAGATSVTTAGNQVYGQGLTLGASTTLTAFSVNFDATVSATQPANPDLTVKATSASFLGGVSGLRNLAVSGSSLVETTSIATGGTQTYTGAVSVVSAAALSATTVTFGSAVLGLSSKSSLSITGNASFAGAVGMSHPLSSLSVSGTASFGTSAPSAATSGTQTFTGAVTLGTSTTFTGSTISFGASVNDTAAGADNLTIAGNAVFNGPVGSTTAFQSVTVVAPSATQINGGAVDTTRAQTYGGAVTIGTAAAAIAASSVTFASTVQGPGLTISASGAVALDGAVTTAALAVIGTGPSSALTINAATVNTTGAQSYKLPVTIATDTALSATQVAFTSTLAAPGSNTLTITADASFAGALSGLTALSVSGKTTIGFASLATSGSQSYGGAVTLLTSTSLTASALTFGSTIDDGSAAGTDSLTVTGPVSFGGAIGSAKALAALTVTGSSIAINGGGAVTQGSQSYNGPVTIGAATALTSTGSGSLTFAGTVNGTDGLTLSAAQGTISFAGAVGAQDALGTITIARAAQVTESAGITAAGFVQQAGTGTTTLNGPVQTTGAAGVAVTTAAIAVNDAIVTANSGPVSFTDSQSLIIAAAGAITASGAVTQSGAGPVSINASITTSGGAVQFASTVTLSTAMIVASHGGAVSFGSAVVGGANTDLQINAGAGNVTFSGTIDGAFTLTANSSGMTAFRGVVGGAVPLFKVVTDAAGTTNIAASMNTSGDLTFNDPVYLSSDIVLIDQGPDSSGIAFNSTLDSASAAAPRALTVESNQPKIFRGSIGARYPLKSLTTEDVDPNAPAAPTSIGATVIATTGDQTYEDAVVLTVATDFEVGGSLSFASLTAAPGTSGALTVTTGGNSSSVDLSNVNAPVIVNIGANGTPNGTTQVVTGGMDSTSFVIQSPTGGGSGGSGSNSFSGTGGNNNDSSTGSNIELVAGSGYNTIDVSGTTVGVALDLGQNSGQSQYIYNPALTNPNTEGQNPGGFINPQLYSAFQNSTLALQGTFQQVIGGSNDILYAAPSNSNPTNNLTSPDPGSSIILTGSNNTVYAVPGSTIYSFSGSNDVIQSFTNQSSSQITAFLASNNAKIQAFLQSSNAAQQAFIVKNATGLSQYLVTSTAGQQAFLKNNTPGITAFLTKNTAGRTAFVTQNLPSLSQFLASNPTAQTAFIQANTASITQFLAGTPAGQQAFVQKNTPGITAFLKKNTAGKTAFLEAQSGGFLAFLLSDPTLLAAFLQSDAGASQAYTQGGASGLESYVQSNPAALTNFVAADPGSLQTYLTSSPTAIGQTLLNNAAALNLFLQQNAPAIAQFIAGSTAGQHEFLAAEGSGLATAIATTPATQQAYMQAESASLAAFILANPNALNAFLATSAAAQHAYASGGVAGVQSYLANNPTALTDYVAADPTVLAQYLLATPSSLLGLLTSNSAAELAYLAQNGGDIAQFVAGSTAAQQAYAQQQGAMVANDLATTPATQGIFFQQELTAITNYVLANVAVLDPFLTSNTAAQQAYEDGGTNELTGYLQSNPNVLQDYLTANPHVIAQYLTADVSNLEQFLGQNPTLLPQFLAGDAGALQQYLNAQPALLSQYLATYSTFLQQYVATNPGALEQYVTGNATILGQYVTNNPDVLNGFLASSPTVVAQYVAENPSALQNYLDSDPSIIAQYIASNPTVLEQFLTSSPTVLEQYLSGNPSALQAYIAENAASIAMFVTGTPAQQQAYLQLESAALAAYLATTPSQQQAYLQQNSTSIAGFIAEVVPQAEAFAQQESAAIAQFLAASTATQQAYLEQNGAAVAHDLLSTSAAQASFFQANSVEVEAFLLSSATQLSAFLAQNTAAHQAYVQSGSAGVQAYLSSNPSALATYVLANPALLQSVLLGSPTALAQLLISSATMQQAYIAQNSAGLAGFIAVDSSSLQSLLHLDGSAIAQALAGSAASQAAYLQAYSSNVIAYLLSSDTRLTSFLNASPSASQAYTHGGADGLLSFLQSNGGVLASYLSANPGVLAQFFTSSPTALQPYLLSSAAGQQAFLQQNGAALAQFLATNGADLAGFLHQDATALAQFIAATGSGQQQYLASDSDGLIAFVVNDPTSLGTLLSSSSSVSQAYAQGGAGGLAQYLQGSPDSLVQFIASNPSVLTSYLSSNTTSLQQFVLGDPAVLVQFVASDPSSLTQYVAASPDLLEEYLAGGTTVLQQYLVASPSVLATYLASNPGVLTQYVATTPSALQRYLAASPTMLAQYIAANPTALEQYLTSDPSIVPAYVTANPGALDQFLLSDPSAVQQYVSANPTVLESFFAAEPTILEEYVAATPSVLQQFLAGDPPAIVDYLNDSPGVLGQYLASNPTIIAQYVANDPTTIAQFLSSDPDALGQFFTSNPAILQQFLTSNPALLQQFLASDPDFFLQILNSSVLDLFRMKVNLSGSGNEVSGGILSSFHLTSGLFTEAITSDQLQLLSQVVAAGNASLLPSYALNVTIDQGDSVVVGGLMGNFSVGSGDNRFVIADPSLLGLPSGTAIPAAIAQYGGTFTGGGGNDRFDFAGGGSGNNFGHVAIDEPAGPGVDSLDFSNYQGGGVNLNLGVTTEQALTPGNLWLTLPSDHEFANVIGSPATDTITGNDLNNTIEGAAVDAPDPNALPAQPPQHVPFQWVYLDFHDPNVAAGETLSQWDPAGAYSTADQQAVLQGLETIYADFTNIIRFSLTPPTAAQAPNGYVTIYYDVTPVVNGQAQPGGLSSEIDFRNLNVSTTVDVDINGFLGTGSGQVADTESDFVNLSITVAAHEVGHTLGLQHPDAFDPIGFGITNPPGTNAYTPSYPGLTGAFNSFENVIASPASVGSTLQDAASGQVHLGERDAVGLAFIADGTVIDGGTDTPFHNSAAAAMAVSLYHLDVPNPITTGFDAGKAFDVNAVDVTGAIGGGANPVAVVDANRNPVYETNAQGQQVLDAHGHPIRLYQAVDDYYTFQGRAGTVMNFNLMSAALTRYASSSFDTQIKILGPDGSLVASNDDDFEGSDSWIIDLSLPQTGTYTVEVSSFHGTASQTFFLDPTSQYYNPEAYYGAEMGNYELFMYSFAAYNPTSGNDTLSAGSGNDTLIGGTGDTTFIVGSGADTVIGGNGSNTVVSTGPASYSLTSTSLDGLGTTIITNVQHASLTDTSPNGGNTFTINPSWTGTAVLDAHSDDDSILVPGSLNGHLTVVNNLVQVTIDNDLAGSLNVESVTSTSIGGSIIGPFNASGDLDQLQVGRNVVGALNVQGTIGTADVAGSLTRTGTITAGKVTSLTIGPATNQPVAGSDLAGALNVSGTLLALTVDGGTPGTISAGKIGTIGVFGGFGPFIAQIDENGVQRYITATLPGAPYPVPVPLTQPVPATSPAGVTFRYFYESKGLASPQATVRVSNGSGNTTPDQFDFNLLTYSKTARFNLARLDASGVSGIRDVAVEGDLLNQVTAAATAFFVLPGGGVDPAPGGVYLPRDPLASVAARDFMATRSITASSLQALAFGSYTYISGGLRLGTQATVFDALQLVARGTPIVQAGSTNGQNTETYRVPFTGAATQHVVFFVDTGPSQGAFDYAPITLTIQGNGTAAQPNNAARGAVIALITASRPANARNPSVIQNVALRGDGGSLNSKEYIAGTIASTGPLGDVTVQSGLGINSITAPSIFGSITTPGAIAGTICTTGVRTDPITGATSTVAADLGRTFTTTVNGAPVTTTTTIHAYALPASAKIVSHGDLVSLVTADAGIQGVIEAVGNIGVLRGSTHLGGIRSNAAFKGQIFALGKILGDITIAGPVQTITGKPRSGTIAADGSIIGNLTVGGPFQGNIVTDATLAGNISINGPLQRGYIAARTAISGNITINGGLIDGSVIVSGGKIGDSQTGTRLTLKGSNQGIIAAYGAITLGSKTPSGHYYNNVGAARPNPNATAVNAIFTKNVTPLSSSDRFDRSTTLDLGNVDQVLRNLRVLSVNSSGKLRVN
jgi:hypothetical protein